MLVYGRNARLPSATALSDINDESIPVQDHLLKLIKIQDELSRNIEHNFKTAQNKMKKRWDEGTKVHDFEVLDLVYIKNKFRIAKETSEKLQPLYAGPYMIIELPSPTSVRVRRLADGVTIKQTIHVERLKRVNFKKVDSTIRL